MMDLSLEDIEFIKILATSDSTILQAGMNDATKKRLDDRVGMILREYYQENTQNTGTKMTEQLMKFGKQLSGRPCPNCRILKASRSASPKF